MEHQIVKATRRQRKAVEVSSFYSNARLPQPPSVATGCILNPVAFTTLRNLEITTVEQALNWDPKALVNQKRIVPETLLAIAKVAFDQKIASQDTLLDWLAKGDTKGKTKRPIVAEFAEYTTRASLTK